MMRQMTLNLLRRRPDRGGRVSKPLRADKLQQIGLQPRHVGEHQRVRHSLVDPLAP